MGKKKENIDTTPASTEADVNIVAFDFTSLGEVSANLFTSEEEVILSVEDIEALKSEFAGALNNEADLNNAVIEDLKADVEIAYAQVIERDAEIAFLKAKAESNTEDAVQQSISVTDTTYAGCESTAKIMTDKGLKFKYPQFYIGKSIYTAAELQEKPNAPVLKQLVEEFEAGLNQIFIILK
jgi:lipopolysaccharide biosynthesis regulator YciM